MEQGAHHGIHRTCCTLRAVTEVCPGLVPISAPLLLLQLADTFFAQRGVSPGVEWHVLCVTFVDHVLVQAAAGCRVAITRA